MASVCWGYMLNRWSDHAGPLHALKQDGSPACGASYYCSAGQAEPHAQAHGSKCHNCLRLRTVKEATR